MEIVERERGRRFSDEQRLIRNARAYVAQYLKRGKLCKGRCEICGEPQVLAAWDDPRVPCAVRWQCREHYNERREAKHGAAEARESIAAQWAEVRWQLLLLPREAQRVLHDAALRGPAGQEAVAGSFFYWWTLRRELGRYLAAGSSSGFWS